MATHTEWISFGPRQQWRGFLAAPPHAPSQEPLPAVVLIQEAWGVDEHIRDLAQRLALTGFLVLAPDLFSVDGQRAAGLEEEPVAEAKAWLDLNPGVWMDPAKRDAAMAADGERGLRVSRTLGRIFGGIAADRPLHLDILRGALNWLRSGAAPTSSGKVASLGFCMGGGLSAQLACLDPQLAGAVVFYGAAPERTQLSSIACPVLGLYGEADTRVNAGIPAFQQGMQEEGKSLDVHILAGAGHAFLNDTRSSYSPSAARQAWALSLTFLNRVLA